jgi:hypothetical protein
MPCLDKYNLNCNFIMFFNRNSFTMYMCNFGFQLTIFSGFGPWELVQACFSIDLVYFWVNLDHF